MRAEHALAVAALATVVSGCAAERPACRVLVSRGGYPHEERVYDRRNLPIRIVQGVETAHLEWTRGRLRSLRIDRGNGLSNTWTYRYTLDGNRSADELFVDGDHIVGFDRAPYGHWRRAWDITLEHGKLAGFASVRVERDPSGRVARVIDLGEGAKAEVEYDAVGRVVSQGAFRYAYDNCPVPPRWFPASTGHDTSWLEWTDAPRFSPRTKPIIAVNDDLFESDGTPLGNYPRFVIPTPKRLDLPTSPAVERWSISEKRNSANRVIEETRSVQRTYRFQYGDVVLPMIHDSTIRWQRAAEGHVLAIELVREGSPQRFTAERDEKRRLLRWRDESGAPLGCERRYDDSDRVVACGDLTFAYDADGLHFTARWPTLHMSFTFGHDGRVRAIDTGRAYQAILVAGATPTPDWLRPTAEALIDDLPLPYGALAR